MSWQDDIRRGAENFGLTVTSGYRSPGHNAAIGGAPGSLHTSGTPSAPGAIDVAGPANALANFFDELKAAFNGRIKELYLNIPGSGFAAIKNNQALSSNPEAGRPQHLHIAIGANGPTPGQVAMRLGTANAASPEPGLGSRGEAALNRIGQSSASLGLDDSHSCTARVCLPNIPHLLDPPPCLCWSDFWAYGGGSLAVLLGFWMLLGSREN